MYWANCLYSTSLQSGRLFLKRSSAQAAKAQCVIVPCVTLAARETDEDENTPNYEEKAQEIVQSILQDVVNTVAGGEFHFVG